MASQSDQFEREVEETRSQLSGTLEELRGRMTPGRVVDQLLDRARNGPSGEFVRNLGREVRENPMPIVLIGIGIAWLMLATSRTSRAAIASAADSVARAANDIGVATSAAVSTTSDWGQRTAARISNPASSAATTVSNRAAKLAAGAREVTEGLADKARAASVASGAAFEKSKPPLTGVHETAQSSERPFSTGLDRAMATEDACAVEAAHEPR